jgi:hypothetical protein
MSEKLDLEITLLHLLTESPREWEILNDGSGVNVLLRHIPTGVKLNYWPERPEYVRETSGLASFFSSGETWKETGEIAPASVSVSIMETTLPLKSETLVRAVEQFINETLFDVYVQKINPEVHKRLVEALGQYPEIR